MSDMMSIRVPKEYRKKLKKFKQINWSEVVRKAIATRIDEEERKMDIKEAVSFMDGIRERILKSQGSTDYDSSEAIRRWRETRR